MIENQLTSNHDDTAHSGNAIVNTRMLSTILRLFGSLVLVSALSIFLFHGWSVGDGIYRFASLLGFSGLLTGAGFVCANLIDEKIGARFFLGIALISVTVNFAVAGSLIYSTFLGPPGIHSLPQYAIWTMSADIPIALFALLALGALSPVALLAFRALARRSAGTLLGIFMFANLILLLPIRDTNLIITISVIAFGLGFRRLVLLAREDVALATWEGRYAAAASLLPIMIVIGRALFFYEHTSLLMALLATMLYVFVRYAGAHLNLNRWWGIVFDLGALLVAISSASFYSVFVGEYFSNAESIQIPLFCVLVAIAMSEQSRHSTINAAHLQNKAALLTCAGFTLNMFLYPAFVSGIINTLVGIGVLSIATSMQRRLMFLLGLMTAGAGLVVQLSLVSHWFDFGNWLGLAALGVVVILSASLLERHGERFSARIIYAYRNFRRWN